MPIPTHVQSALIASGDLTPTRISTRPQHRPCPTCRAACQTAIPTLLSGAHWVDAWPTTTLGELLALTSGRATYAVRPREMEMRDEFYIGAIDANRAGFIHAAHICGNPSPIHPRPKFFRAPSNFSTPPF